MLDSRKDKPSLEQQKAHQWLSENGGDQKEKGPRGTFGAVIGACVCVFVSYCKMNAYKLKIKLSVSIGKF